MRGKGGLTGMPVGKSKAIMNPGGLRVAKRPISTSKPIAPAGRSIHKDSRDEAPYSRIIYTIYIYTIYIYYTIQ